MRRTTPREHARCRLPCGWHPRNARCSSSVSCATRMPMPSSALLPVTSAVIATAADTPRAMPANELAARVRLPMQAIDGVRADARRRSSGAGKRHRMRRRLDLPRRRGSRVSRAVVSCGNSSSLTCIFRHPLSFLLWRSRCRLWRSRPGAGSSTQRRQPATPSKFQRLPLVSRTGLRASRRSSASDKSGGDRRPEHDSSPTTSTSSPNRVVVASGNVVFTNADGRISAERVEFNTAQGTGTFYDASGIMSLGNTVERSGLRRAGS